MDGNDVDAVVAGLNQAKTFVGRLADRDTDEDLNGQGIDFMEGSHEWHGIAPTMSNTKAPGATARNPQDY